MVLRLKSQLTPASQSIVALRLRMRGVILVSERSRCPTFLVLSK